MVIKIREARKKVYVFVLSFIYLGCFTSCNLSGLAGEGIDAAEDSGYQLYILNYSDKQYNACAFYLGYTNIHNNFVKTDSLVYSNIVIYKKGTGPNYNENSGYSITYPSSQNNKGLNKYGVWEPNEETKKLYFDNIGVSLKIELEGVNLISNSNHGLNGSLSFRILENSDISW